LHGFWAAIFERCEATVIHNRAKPAATGRQGGAWNAILMRNFLFGIGKKLLKF
jgi:hypothetical protein